jgi:dimethylhistidine N-methyltransferase
VEEGLRASPKWLPARYFYDAVGSALFDVITLLPEYGLTRADERVLGRAAPVLPDRLGRVEAIAELGSGSGRKTRLLLGAFASRQAPLRYVAIDGSRTALERCRREVSELPGVDFEGLEEGYLDGLSRVVRERGGDPILVLFLGGSIGNFNAGEADGFLKALRQLLRPGDGLVLGTDLVKPVPELLLAYDDPAGVTAAFNLNLLARINRELGGGFDLRRFRHEARWSEADLRIEMHLRSLVEQEVEVQAIGTRFSFRRDETIWTESSHRYTPALLASMAERAGFAVADGWTDEAWPFRESLWTVPGA